MTSIWPFAPTSEMIEACEWLTDVQPSYSSEERVCLRETPLRSFAITHVLDHAQQAAAKTLAASAKTMLMPDWPRAVSMVAATGAPVDLPDGQVVVWRSSSVYEQTSVSDGVLGVVANSGLAKVVPLLLCRVADSYRADRRAGKYASGSITFQTASGSDEGANVRYSIYDGLPVVLDACVIGSGTFAEAVDIESVGIDNGISLAVDVQTSGYAFETFGARWVAKSQIDYSSIRAWIYSRRGRWLPFWLPSHAQDLGAVTVSGSIITVSQYDERELYLMVRIEGANHIRRITGSAPTTGGYHLVIDSDLPAGSVQSAQYMRKVRFNADRIEFRHAAGEGVAVSVPCARVPS